MDENKKSWYLNSTIYQIYTLSFKDSNGDGYGDLPGIIEKLDYLRELGADAIWLTPFYKSPLDDFGYDVSDHNSVDPLFGYLFDFNNLVSEAHKRGIKIIIDLVLNHTSAEHKWFKESCSSKDNSKRDWYVWREGRDEENPPNDWVSVFGGSAWTKHEGTNEWYLHTFLPTQPDLNWHNPEVKEAIFKIIDFWLTQGVDGFRGDAISHLFEDSEFSDEESNTYFRPGFDDPYTSVLHTKTENLPETIRAVLEISEYVRKYGDIVFISEAYLDLDGLLHVYRNCPAKNHMPFNFNFMSLPWNTEAYKEFTDRYMGEAEGMPKNFVLGNHDRHRVSTRFGREKSLALAVLEFTLPLAAFVYYGEEIGMEDALIEREGELDEWGKRVPGLNLGRDAERGVMQWDDSPYAGFSTVRPWINVPQNYEKTNVASQRADDKSVLAFYKKLIKFKKLGVFKNGTYEPCEIQNEKIFSFKRDNGGKSAFIFVNMSDEELPFEVKGGGKILISSFLDDPAPESPLRPNEARIIMFGD